MKITVLCGIRQHFQTFQQTCWIKLVCNDSTPYFFVEEEF